MKKVKQQRAVADFSKKLLITLCVLIIGVAAISYLLLRTNDDEPVVIADAYQMPASEQDIQDGAVLSRQYCRSCHLLPDPLLLNKNKWKKILPQMGLRLGIKSHYGESYEETLKSSELLVPSQPLLNHTQWQHIIAYYMSKAPMFLPAQHRTVPIKREMPFFSLIGPAKSFSGRQVLGTYVKIDTTVKPSRIFVADGQSKKLFLLNSKMQVLDSVSTTGPVVDISFAKNQVMVCMIGKELGANDEKAGIISNLTISSTGKMTLNNTPVFNDLMRPVQVLAADLNADQQTDYLICEFGNLAGKLSWMENKGHGAYVNHTISKLPGAVKVYIEYNANSKLPDIWVLFTQGQERISHLINKGKGNFQEIPVLKFPAIYGSSFFERVDINHDGYKDIIYTCGDNGNATLVLKPFMYLSIMGMTSSNRSFFIL